MALLCSEANALVEAGGVQVLLAALQQGVAASAVVLCCMCMASAEVAASLASA